MENDILDKYSVILSEIRKRVVAAEMLSKENNNVIYIESTTLQIRKILELISYLSLLVNRNKVDEKVSKDYHAKRILEAIESVTTIFYPIPSILVPPNNQNNQPTFIPLGYSDSLSLVEFKKAYYKCGGIAHAQRPFEKKINFKKYSIFNIDMINKLKILLQRHTICVRNTANKYTFLHAELDFVNDGKRKDTNISGFETDIYDEDELVRLFNKK